MRGGNASTGIRLDKVLMINWDCTCDKSHLVFVAECKFTNKIYC